MTVKMVCAMMSLLSVILLCGIGACPIFLFTHKQGKSCQSPQKENKGGGQKFCC